MPRKPSVGKPPKFIVYGAGERPYGVESITLARKLAKQRVQAHIDTRRLDLPGGPTRPEAYIEKLVVPKLPGVRVPPPPRYEFLEKHKLDDITGQIRRQIHLD